MDTIQYLTYHSITLHTIRYLHIPFDAFTYHSIPLLPIRYLYIPFDAFTYHSFPLLPILACIPYPILACVLPVGVLRRIPAMIWSVTRIQAGYMDGR